MAIFRKLDLPKPTVTAPRPKPQAAPPPPAPPPAKPAVNVAEKLEVNKRTGRTSSFEAFRPPSVSLDKPQSMLVHEQQRSNHATSQGSGDCSQGRNHGTADDSIGVGDPTQGRNHGTADDSIGVGDPTQGRNRGTPDDSIGVNDPSEGRNRGTPDDSIGTGDVSEGRNRGTPDDSIGGDGPVGPRNPGLGERIRDRLGEILRGADGTAAARVGLPEETQAKMDALLSPPGSRTAAEARYVFSHQSFHDMPAADREKLVDVMSAGGEKAARATAELFFSSDGADFNQTSPDGTRLLDSLDKMAGSTAGQKMIGDLMYDICRPGRIQQGRAPTCTVSSMQYELASQQPAEYARLMAGLAVDGEVTMRGGGTLKMNASSAMFFSSWNGDERTPTEAVFQSAAMDFANGADPYSLLRQESTGAERNYKGLFPEQIREMVGQLFGVKYETLEITSDAQASAELQEILSRETANRPVLFDIDMGDFNHCVSLEGVKGDNVIYRDPTTGELETMSKQEFRERLVAVHYAQQPARPEIDRDFLARKYGSSKMMLV